MDSVKDLHNELELDRREFVFAGMASLSTVSGGQLQIRASQPVEEYEFQGIAQLEGPRSARPSVNGEFFNGTNQSKIVYAYRYIDEVTKASWYTTQDLDQWHPEPLGAADVTTDNGEAHSVSVVSRDGDLYLRRYQ